VCDHDVNQKSWDPTSSHNHITWRYVLLATIWKKGKKNSNQNLRFRDWWTITT
jgi:hypothetical protein